MCMDVVKLLLQEDASGTVKNNHIQTFLEPRRKRGPQPGRDMSWYVVMIWQRLIMVTRGFPPGTSTVTSRCSIVQRGAAVDVHGRSEAASAGRRLRDCEEQSYPNFFGTKKKARPTARSWYVVMIWQWLIMVTRGSPPGTSTVTSGCSIVQRGAAVDVHGRSEAASAGRRLRDCEEQSYPNFFGTKKKARPTARSWYVVICRDDLAAVNYGDTGVSARDIDGHIPLQHCAARCCRRCAWTKWSCFCRKTPLCQAP